MDNPSNYRTGNLETTGKVLDASVPRVLLDDVLAGYPRPAITTDSTLLKSGGAPTGTAIFVLPRDAAVHVVDTLNRSEHFNLNSIWTDAAAIGLGLATKYGAEKLLTRGPMWTKPIGLLAGAVVAGFSKDLLVDGHLGDTNDLLRGAGVYGTVCLGLKILSFNPSSTKLSPHAVEGLSLRTGVANLNGTSGQMAEQIIAGGYEGSVLTRNHHFLVPMNYTGFAWDNGLRFSKGSPLAYAVAIRPGFKFVGFGGEAGANAVGHGMINFWEFNARRQIGQSAVLFGTASTLGGGRAAVYELTRTPKR